MAIVIDALAEAAVSNLFQSVTSLLKDKVDLIRNAKFELEKLQEKLERLQKTIKVVERKPFFSNERNRDLEAELKDVLYDAQDIIERYQTTIALCKSDKHPITSWNKVSKPWTTMCSCFKEHVSASYKLANDIKNINQKLDKIEQRKEMMDLLNTTPKVKSEDPVGGEHDNPRETTHLTSTAQPPMGRVDDKEKVKELLFQGFTESSVPGKDGVSIVSIVGQGGIGKTTLAKMVFNEVEKQFGKRRWWVCVSENPNRTGLLQKILIEVCKEFEGETLKGVTSFSDLCTRLQSELSMSKFLLVLDDVWELGWWEGEVEGILLGGAKESKILITSRKVEVSQGIGAKMHKLPKMSFDESWSLFLHVALKQEHELESHNLKIIGVKIVEKCGGFPLVVQTVGSLMRTKRMTKDDWESVEKSEIWEWKMPASSSSSEICGSIFPGLMLSYDDLPHYLKSCFVYCCIYPKDYEIKRHRLVMQWMAHGLIGQKKGIDVEVTANQWINDLTNRFMIEETEYKNIKLHDILHDLALYIGGKEYSHVSTTKHTRHLSLLGVDDAEVHKLNASGAANKLHTLLVDSNFGSKSNWHLVYIKRLTTNFKWLRVLSLREYSRDKLPKSIEDLSLLKYFDLSYSDVRWLPSSIGRLYNLQTLDLSQSRIEELPKEMGELCNLRYLGLKGTRSLRFVAEGLGKLTNLRTLHRFMVCDDKGKTRGCNINELKDLNKLKGELSIGGLQGGRVKVMDAKEVHLKERHELNGVELVFGSLTEHRRLVGALELDLEFPKFEKAEIYFEEQEDERVGSAFEERGLLEALEPPHGIERLAICGYKGDGPVWYLDTNYKKLRTLSLLSCPSWATVIGIKSLEKLEVRECPTLGALPSIPLLKSLDIKWCDGLNTIGDLPALESLEVKGCGRVEQVADDHMPALKTLKLSDLNILKQLPTRLPSLEELEVTNLPNWETTFTSMPCLRKGIFKNCPKMQMEGLSDELAGLQRLTVRNCPSARLGWKLLEQLPNLIYLELDSESTVLVPSPLPSQVSAFLYSLKHLDLRDNTNVDGLKWGRVPEWVWGLSQLEVLYLHSFSEDISLGGHWQCLPKLRYLALWYFPNLKSVVEVNNTITAQQQQNGTTCPSDAQQQQIACVSNLQSLTILRCPALHLPQELIDHLGKRLHIYS
ncbi:disease resistance protein RGA2-like [Nymphaea colorata]|nr:disease resistance protein RGA2-like [Nymphaea colorata]